jgi:hypothetical protein
VKYPLKDPIEFQRINWVHIINLVKDQIDTRR